MLGSMLFLVVQSGVAAVDMWTRWCMSDLACPTVFEEADELWRRLMGLAHTVRRSLRSTGRAGGCGLQGQLGIWVALLQSMEH